MHRDGLADDEAIGNELADGLAGVRVGDLVDLIGVKPDLALAATDNGRRKALLRAEIDPTNSSVSIRSFLRILLSAGGVSWAGVLRGGSRHAPAA